ncbi:hypothetical protein PF005_g16316 [Phytophthora fragariae]|uniref:RxLR effector protein n=1 Tax=Phytophthora fragariae TaxID=53985 RepID=A0A6A3THV9_9STRA|nr:hypothetical protein PF003_g35259 [Phytophthora fragariae]KAE8932242.1 hypothetical protein PF009_g17716 [Phytophthora fragariae]KAE9087975.1 hypothetical protein PF007_g20157 [Phytophthora fragariae]KAE9134402.1 hypothetical protein PF006_g14827 [Phytophthora fragariae]KAE9197956.1 hypothetical protein PF005_g16316 [Phytophthora fragariae]
MTSFRILALVFMSSTGTSPDGGPPLDGTAASCSAVLAEEGRHVRTWAHRARSGNH